MNLNNNQKYLFSFITALLISFFAEAYLTAVSCRLNINDFFPLFSFKKLIVLFILSFILFRILYDNELRQKVLDFIYKYRYYLSVLIIAVCVIFQIHGSSINELNLFGIKHDLIAGISRSIRSDEYLVNTMLAFSQYHNGFGYFSDIVRAAPTDMFIIYGQAVFDIAVIFRPFNIGYLFLNQGMGLSFFWVSRFVVLTLVSFEMGMLLTNKNKILSLSYAILVILSPLVQWWFAINGLVEQLIFGQLGVLLINFYMNTIDYRKRILSALLMIVCIGGFLVVFYPSWQIPFAYVFILLAIWIFLKNRNNFAYDKKDLLIIFTSLIILGLLMIHILNNSLDTIKIIMNTAYPGGERFNGAGEWEYFFNYLASIFFPLTEVNLPINVVEHSVFIDFFPIPIIISIIVLVIQKTKDKLLLGLLTLYLIFIIFYFIPLPDSIISLTLRDHMKTTRLFDVISFISLLILIRSLASLKEIKAKKLLIIASAILSVIVVYLSTLYYHNYYNFLMVIALVIIYAITFSSIFTAHSEKGKIIFLICVIFISFTAGALINPIDHGTDVVLENDYSHEVESIVHQDPNGKWIVSELKTNYIIATGAKTISSINVYPDLDKWHVIDPNGQYEDIYNRYAHITVDFQNETNTTFNLVSADLIHINMNVNDLEKLNVSYISTPKDLEQFSNGNVTFEKIYEKDSYKIYHLKYN
ncbi:hypothetical protein [uncultured Methanobrevibacter sp.]|uniref:DUF7657 domain-containing protein n=1 Tax=uncultured Methanobrevibacter sp. TaxID=253161 RepID=UPI0025FB9B54|nr:hypothetical protein [uncultured Methanobrevibacter sp.]